MSPPEGGVCHVSSVLKQKPSIGNSVNLATSVQRDPCPKKGFIDVMSNTSEHFKQVRPLS